MTNRLKILESKKDTIGKKVKTSQNITEQLGILVEAGGFQRIQYLQQLDSLYELQNQLNNIKLEINRTKIESEKSIGINKRLTWLPIPSCSLSIP